MKKTFKYWLIAILFCSVLSISIFNLHRSSVIDSFESKTRILDSSWSKIFANSNERIVLLQSIVSKLENKNIIVDSLAILIEKYRKYENLYKKECTLDFVKLEFDLNKVYLEIMLHFKNDTLFEKNVKNALMQLQLNNKEANIEIDNYNNLTLRYNKYLSVFPNFIFAKKYGYSKRKYFIIKYGIENKDPIAKNKELPEWAKDIDTL